MMYEPPCSFLSKMGWAAWSNCKCAITLHAQHYKGQDNPIIETKDTTNLIPLFQRKIIQIPEFSKSRPSSICNDNVESSETRDCLLDEPSIIFRYTTICSNTNGFYSIWFNLFGQLFCFVFAGCIINDHVATFSSKLFTDQRSKTSAWISAMRLGAIIHFLPRATCNQHISSLEWVWHCVVFEPPNASFSVTLSRFGNRNSMIWSELQFRPLYSLSYVLCIRGVTGDDQPRFEGKAFCSFHQDNFNTFKKTLPEVKRRFIWAVVIWLNSAAPNWETADNATMHIEICELKLNAVMFNPR